MTATTPQPGDLVEVWDETTWPGRRHEDTVIEVQGLLMVGDVWLGQPNLKIKVLRAAGAPS